MAATLLQEISRDEIEKAHARSRRMYETDLYSNIHTAEARGKIEGRAEGKIEGKIEIARNLLSKGSSYKFIQEITELDLDTIKNIYPDKSIEADS